MIHNNDSTVARHLQIADAQIKKAEIYLQSKSRNVHTKWTERGIAVRALENAISQLENAKDRLTRNGAEVSA